MTTEAVVRGYLAAFASGDPDQVAERVSDGFVNEHTAVLGTGCIGKAAYRERLPGFLATFAGLRYDVDDVVAEGERATAAYTMHAEFQGTPTTVRGVMRFVVSDGHITHRIDYWDSLAFLLQVDPAVRAKLTPWLAEPTDE